jgi:two-component system, OmpR family, response regulator
MSRSANVERILVIDDDRIMLDTARSLLQQAGFQVVTYSGAFNRLNAIVEEEPDLVLLDVNMPLVPGDTLARLMREDPRLQRIPFAFFSSNGEGDLRRLVRESGACGYISKSDMGFFAAKVRRLLEIAKSRPASPLHVME